jgi:hypothetical protein
MAANGKIIDLRALLAERFPSIPSKQSNVLTTSLSTLDPMIGGGLPKGAITELISPRMSAGTASLIAALLRAAHRDGYFLALIDGRDSFDPEPLGNACLRHLFWLRCRTTGEAIKGADLLLRDGNFPLVIIDLVLNSGTEVRKIKQPTWYRLQRLVEPTSTAFLVLTRFSTVSSAHLKIILENAWTLRTFRKEDPISHVQIRIQRLHGSSRASGTNPVR